MTMAMRRVWCVGLALVFMSSVAQAQSSYDPLKTFAPLTLPDPVNEYRSGNGAPGPAYWQNRADYTLHASLDPVKKELRGDEVITYTNNSPGPLTSLWIQLDENMYRRDARAARDPERKTFTDGDVLDAVETGAGTKAHYAAAKYVISDTRMQIQLAAPLAGHGGKITVHIKYHYTVPVQDGGRTSWGPSKNGDIFDIAQWYPRMCVYDDLRGWDTLPYIAQEFYLEYGSFDYFVTVPADMVVAGSGLLVNSAAVLTSAQQSRLVQARASDKTVTIRSATEALAATAAVLSTATKTWHFHMDKTRDVAFSASRVFVWDAARINLPDGKKSLAMSFYPVESAGDAAWGRSTEYLKDSVERFSKRWYVYPYPVAVNVAGPTDGMENPGLLFDGPDDTGKTLFWITAHEIGHTWFPMVVGFNERRNAWMDEGFNTFIDTFESDDFHGGEYAPKRDSEFAPNGGNPADEIIPVIQDPNSPVILTRADAIEEKYRHPVTYFKSALGLSILREQILGPQRFDFAFRKFIADWAFKHPSPSDFFRAMESEGGEDLSYFWRGWYENNWTLDMAAKDLKYNDPSDPSQGAHVIIVQNGQLVLPAWVQVKYDDGTDLKIKLPAETWMQKAIYNMPLPTTKKILEVNIDPDHRVPDADRTNNTAKP